MKISRKKDEYISQSYVSIQRTETRVSVFTGMNGKLVHPNDRTIWFSDLQLNYIN